MKTKKLKLGLIILLTSFLFGSCEDDATIADFFEENPFGNIVNTWDCEEDGGTVFGTNSYQVSIYKNDDDGTQIFISNFLNMGDNVSVEAILIGNKLSILSQTFGDITVKGSGTIALNSKSIDWEYSVVDGDISGDLTANYTIANISK